MFVRDIMSTHVPECTEDMGLESVFELIQQCDHRVVVVIESISHRVPIGVVTERSICEQIIERGRNPKGLLAGSVIDSRIRKVVGTDLVEKLGDIDHSDVAAIVVVDDNRQICGLIARERMRNLSSVTSRPNAPVPVVASSVRSGSDTVSELPASGWIQ